jgi:hypothetical protein
MTRRIYPAIALPMSPGHGYEHKLATEALFNRISKQQESAVAMLAIEQYINRCAKRGELNSATLTMANIALEGFACNADVPYQSVMYAAESAGHGVPLTQTSQAIRLASEGVFSSIKDGIAAVGEHIAKALSIYHYRFQSYEKRARKLLSTSAGKDQQASPKQNYVQPREDYALMCYSTGGFNKGLRQAVSDVNRFISDHEKMCDKLINKYVGWAKMNISRGDAAFEHFSVDEKDFTIPGMQVFDRSIGQYTPRGDNVFFRSSELPGGVAFYTECTPGQITGPQAIKAFESVGFSMDIHNPASYNTFISKLCAIATLGVWVWMASMGPLVLSAAPAVMLPMAIISEKLSHHEGTGTTVSIPKDMMFETMSLDEINNVLTHSLDAMQGVDKWYNTVMQKPWKSHDLDRVIHELTDAEGAGSLTKSFCSALVRLIDQMDTLTEEYAFDFYEVCLRYCEDCLKQYK